MSELSRVGLAPAFRGDDAEVPLQLMCKQRANPDPTWPDYTALHFMKFSSDKASERRDRLSTLQESLLHGFRFLSLRAVGELVIRIRSGSRGDRFRLRIELV